MIEFFPCFKHILSLIFPLFEDIIIFQNESKLNYKKGKYLYSSCIQCIVYMFQQTNFSISYNSLSFQAKQAKRAGEEKK